MEIILFGIKTFSDSGFIQIDSETGKDAYKATVTGKASYNDKDLINIKIQSNSYPLLAVKNGAGKIKSVSKDSKGVYTSVSIAVLPDFVDGKTHVDYSILTTGFFNDSNDGYGVQIYNSDGSIKYSTKYKFMKIKEVIDTKDHFEMISSFFSDFARKTYKISPKIINTCYGELRSEGDRLRPDLMTLKTKAKNGGLWLITNTNFGLLGNQTGNVKSASGFIQRQNGDTGTSLGTPLIGINDRTIIFLQHFQMIDYSGIKPSKPYQTNGKSFNFYSDGNVLLVDI
ncbi:hypothetical protein AB832_07305 [Flavobacteriaceae bacterium (ex Bugula neritina AB1)]|nr:hypothetical protein AB832_07305 [Flavobacteriaceae bacterium (ex Bugula neritina AB1)]